MKLLILYSADNRMLMLRHSYSWYMCWFLNSRGKSCPIYWLALFNLIYCFSKCIVVWLIASNKANIQFYFACCVSRWPIFKELPKGYDSSLVRPANSDIRLIRICAAIILLLRQYCQFKYPNHHNKIYNISQR